MGNLLAKVPDPFAAALNALADHQRLNNRLLREKEVSAYDQVGDNYKATLSSAIAQLPLQNIKNNYGINPPSPLGGAI